MKTVSFSLVALTVLMTVAGSAHAQVLIAGYDSSTSAPVPTATPILGVDTPDYSQLGTAYAHNGNLPNMDDGNTSTREDTYGGFASDVNSSYVGFSFAAPVDITSMTVNFQLNGDGGWFGTPQSRPSDSYANTPPLDGYLIEPTLQYSTDGVTWITVADSSNYLSTLDGLGESSGNTPLVTFTPTTAIVDASYIRLVGPSGGTAGSPGGFLAVNEESVYGSAVPEPTTYAMLFGGLGMLGLYIRRRNASSNI